MLVMEHFVTPVQGHVAGLRSLYERESYIYVL